MDKIFLPNLAFWGTHGVLPQESKNKQKFIIDAQIEGDFSAACASDDLNDAVDYSKFYEIIRQTVEEESYYLLEALAGAICQKSFVFPQAQTVRIGVEKVKAPIIPTGIPARVEIERSRKFYEKDK